MAYGLTQEEMDDRFEKFREMIANKDSAFWAAARESERTAAEQLGLPAPPEQHPLTDVAHIFSGMAILLSEIILENNARWEQALREAGILR